MADAILNVIAHQVLVTAVTMTYAETTAEKLPVEDGESEAA